MVDTDRIRKIANALPWWHSDGTKLLESAADEIDTLRELVEAAYREGYEEWLIAPEPRMSTEAWQASEARKRLEANP